MSWEDDLLRDIMWLVSLLKPATTMPRFAVVMFVKRQWSYRLLNQPRK